jgi:hypothetical protein
MPGKSGVSEEQYKALLLEAAKLIRVLGANDGVSSVIPDFLEGDRNFNDTLQIMKGIVVNWQVKENILFQVWTLKQNYDISNEEIAAFWPEWYTKVMHNGDAALAEDGEPGGIAGE